MYYGYSYPMYGGYDYRGQHWTNVMTALQYSAYAEAMVCAMSSEFYHIDELKNLKGNSEMHKHLVPASYHRITALGSSIRLANGEDRESVVNTLKSCINNAQREDKGVMDGLKMMQDAAPEKYKATMRQLIQWQETAEKYLKQAEDQLEQEM
jgi:hypothetical protein